MNHPIRTPASLRAALTALSFMLGALLLAGCSDKPAEHAPPDAAKQGASDTEHADAKKSPPTSHDKKRTEHSPASPQERRGAMRGQMTVSVVHPIVKTVPITTTAAATLASPNAVTLTPQVSGTLKSVHVVSGQRVKAGQLLFSLDAAPFRTALSAAEAKLKGDIAQARYTAQQVKQLTPLVEKDYVTRQSYDQAVASAQAASAQVAQDQAAVQTARINLSYTEIRAPISGRLGEISLQPGNLVQANNTALTTLVSIRELLVNFSLPQRVLSDVRREWPGMGQPSAQGKPPAPGPRIDILDEQAAQVLGSGYLSFVDNTINPTTGTIRLQGLIDNPAGRLWPGQFVTARLTLREIPHAEVLPATAVQLGDQGSFVYVVRHDTVETLPIEPLHTLATEVALPAGSIPLDAQVVYPLPGRIAPGMTVHVRPPHAPAAGGGHGHIAPDTDDGQTRQPQGAAPDTGAKP